MNVAALRAGRGKPPGAARTSFRAALRRGAARLEPAAAAPQRPRLDAAAPCAAAPDRPALAGAAAVHRVATAVEALRVADRGRLELVFHGGATLQLETTAAGVALMLSAAASVARTAAAELPALVAALQRRGVAVARAEVKVAPDRRTGGRRPR